MSLLLDLRVERPAFTLDVGLSVDPGEVVALLGANGAGKTTVLRAVAGLQPLTAGSVLLDGVALQDLPPEDRRVGLVPQDGLLLPHLSARDNVAYGLRARGTRRSEARRRADEELGRLGLADRAGDRPRQLSGGQAQRVALARALATDPAVLLLDEPLAALDALTRTEVRTDLRARLAAVAAPTLLVTHDLADAHVLADRLVVLDGGRVVQEGAPAEVAARPRTPWVAGLVGLVLLRGTADRDGVRVEQLHLPGPAPAGKVLVALPPEAVALSAEPSPGAWPVVVRGVEQRGAGTHVQLDGAPAVEAVVPATALRELDLRPGRQLWASVDAARVQVYA